MALVDELRLAKTRTKAFEFNVLLNGKDLSDLYQDMVTILKNQEGASNNYILTTYAAFKDAMSLTTALEPNRSYYMQDGIPSSYLNGGIVHFNTDSIGVPKPECQILFGINVGGGGTPNTGYLLGIFRIANDGTFDDSFPFSELYYPSNNIKIIKPLMNMSAGGLNAFLAFCSDNTDTYQNIVIEDGADLSNGIPSKCKNWTFGPAMHEIQSGVELYDGYTVKMSDLIHKFPADCIVRGGQVGGRGASAEMETVIDITAMAGVLDLSNYPICGQYQLTGGDSAPLKSINLSGADGANHNLEIWIDVSKVTDGGSIQYADYVLMANTGFPRTTSYGIKIHFGSDMSPWCTFIG